MAYVAFASAKASPGVTTTITALAATWPEERPLLLVEADPAGGDLAVRLDLSPDPGLVTLAAAGRRDLDRDTLLAHTQVAPGPGRHHAQHGAVRRVVPAPVAGDQASAALVALRGRLSRVLKSLEMDVLVDCGRLDHNSPALQLATGADLLIVVARPVVAEIHHLTSRLSGLDQPATSLLLVGEAPYTVEEVAEAVRVAPLGAMPHDPRAASAMMGGHPDAMRVLRRSRLLRSAGALAQGLAHWLGATTTATNWSADPTVPMEVQRPPSARTTLPPPPTTPPLPVPPPPQGMQGSAPAHEPGAWGAAQQVQWPTAPLPRTDPWPPTAAPNGDRDGAVDGVGR